MATFDAGVPDTAVALAARDVAGEYCSESLFNHCVRSYIFAREHAVAVGVAFDDELLYVASMLHDMGLTAAFDSHAIPFEEAGGHVAWVLSAGAGWARDRRSRLAEVIVRHMWDEVDAADDPEGHLLAFSTALDISGADLGKVSDGVRARVLAAYPRLDLVAEFSAAMADQAARKPSCAASSFVSGGGLDRLGSNPLNSVH